MEEEGEEGREEKSARVRGERWEASRRERAEETPPLPLCHWSV